MVKHTDFSEVGEILREDTEWIQLLHIDETLEDGYRHYFIGRDDEATDALTLSVIRVSPTGEETPYSVTQFERQHAIPDVVKTRWTDEFLPDSVRVREYYRDFDGILEQPRSIKFNFDGSWESTEQIPQAVLDLFDNRNLAHAVYYQYVDFPNIDQANPTAEQDEVYSSLNADHPSQRALLDNIDLTWDKAMGEYYAQYPDHKVLQSDALEFFLDKGFSRDQVLENLDGIYVAISGTKDPLYLTDGVTSAQHVGTIVNGAKPVFVELVDGNLALYNHLWEDFSLEGYYWSFDKDFPYDQVIESPRFRPLIEQTLITWEPPQDEYHTKTTAEYVEGKTFFTTTQCDAYTPQTVIDLQAHLDQAPQTSDYVFRWDWEGKLFWKPTLYDKSVSEVYEALNPGEALSIEQRSYESFLEYNGAKNALSTLAPIHYPATLEYEQIRTCYAGLPDRSDIEVEGYDLVSLWAYPAPGQYPRMIEATYINQDTSKNTIEGVTVNLFHAEGSWHKSSVEAFTGQINGNEIVFNTLAPPHQALIQYLDANSATMPKPTVVEKASGAQKASEILKAQHPTMPDLTQPRVKHAAFTPPSATPPVMVERRVL